MTTYLRSPGTPFFRLIYQHLKEEIERGDYAPGARLPSESELSRAYGVQRDTARRALRLLVDEGLIYKRPGCGSYVSDDRAPRTFTIDPAHLNDPIVAHLINSGILTCTEPNR